MKRFLTALAACAVTSASFGLSWTDRDPNSGNGPLEFLEESYWWDGGTVVYDGVFNIGLDGFDAALHAITGIKVSFAFADDNPLLDIIVGEYVDILVGGMTLWDSEEVDGTHDNPPDSYDWLSMDLDPVLHKAIYDDLADNGKVGYQVMIKDLNPDVLLGLDREDTWLKIAELTATGHRVPDSGATVALLGLGLSGLALIRGRRRR